MASRMLTLFGDEMVPEEMQVAPKVGPREPRLTAGKAERSTKEVTTTTPLETVILDGWKPQKQYYTIGEVAELFGVRTSHIRYWTTEFELKVRTTRKGDRLYTPAIIAELRTIYHLLKERGFTIPGAKARLKEAQKPSVETLDLRQALLQLRNQLLLIRNQLL
jgi:DNA-binding transcriptional MerR regulator